MLVSAVQQSESYIYIYTHCVLDYFPMLLCCTVTQACLTLCDPMDCSQQEAPLSMGLSQKEYCSELPFPSPGDLPDPGIELATTASSNHSLQMVRSMYMLISVS